MISELDFLISAEAILSEAIRMNNGLPLDESKSKHLDRLIRARGEVMAAIAEVDA